MTETFFWGKILLAHKNKPKTNWNFLAKIKHNYENMTVKTE